MSDEPPPIKTILVVEDNSATASQLTELLAHQVACQVIIVSDCLTTLKFLRHCTPDLILLDERLLRSNGIDLGPRLALMKDLQAIPIYLIGEEGAWHGFQEGTGHDTPDESTTHLGKHALQSFV